MTRPDPALNSAKLPTDMAEPRPFGEPWQAQVFALVVSLHEGGLFSWSEWAQSLSRQLKQPGTADDGSDYYECWLRALEELLKKHAIAADAEIGALQAAWQRAAHATPHGNPILLENDPDRSSA